MLSMTEIDYEEFNFTFVNCKRTDVDYEDFYFKNKFPYAKWR